MKGGVALSSLSIQSYLLLFVRVIKMGISSGRGVDTASHVGLVGVLLD